jgi:1-acyl-sn-glycerol-3-phosphate acyltransferase
MRLAGWRVDGEVPDLPKIMLIGAPHTSNWDYILTILTMISLGVDLHYVAKHTAFAGPFGWLFRWLGGISLDRGTTQNFVQQMALEFDRRRQFILAIMPEGTRSKVHRWRSGFYYIAVEATVPILPVVFDYSERIMHLGPLFQPSGDYERDLPLIQARFAGIRGHNDNRGS